MYTAVISDDNPVIIQLLRALLNRFWPDLKIVGEAKDGLEAKSLIESLAPDFAFLDIDMPIMSGLDVARSLPIKINVIFITSHASFALDAFDVEAVDYILKPIDTMKIAKMVSKLKRVAESRLRTKAEPADPEGAGDASGSSDEKGAPSSDLQWVKLSVGSKIRMVHISSIKYFISDHKYTRVVAQGVEGLIRTSIESLTQSLADDFVSPRRGTLVNRSFIHAIYKDESGRTVLEVKDDRQKIIIPPHNRKLFRSM